MMDRFQKYCFSVKEVYTYYKITGNLGPIMTKPYFALILEITPLKGLFVRFVVMNVHLILVYNINMW